MLNAKPGQIIRHKNTREPYLVIYKNAQGWLVVNLNDRIDPASVQIVLMRATENFESDKKIVDMTEKEADIIKKSLKIVEGVQETFTMDETEYD